MSKEEKSERAGTRIHQAQRTAEEQKKQRETWAKQKANSRAKAKQREAEALKKKQEAEAEAQAEALKRKHEAEAEQARQRGEKAFNECLEEDLHHMTDSEFYRARFPSSFGGPPATYVEAISSLKYVDDDRRKAIAMQWAREEDQRDKRLKRKERKRGRPCNTGPEWTMFLAAGNEELRRRGYRYDADHRMWKLQHPHKHWSVYDYAPRYPAAIKANEASKRGEIREPMRRRRHPSSLDTPTSPIAHSP